MALVLLSNLLTTLLKAGLVMLGTAGLRQLCSRLGMPRPPPGGWSAPQ